jgi:hypothetical protein
VVKLLVHLAKDMKWWQRETSEMEKKSLNALSGARNRERPNNGDVWRFRVFPLCRETRKDGL